MRHDGERDYVTDGSNAIYNVPYIELERKDNEIFATLAGSLIIMTDAYRRLYFRAVCARSHERDATTRKAVES